MSNKVLTQYSLNVGSFDDEDDDDAEDEDEDDDDDEDADDVR